MIREWLAPHLDRGAGPGFPEKTMLKQQARARRRSHPKVVAPWERGKVTLRVPIRTLKIWNEVIAASQYRSGCSRENEQRSIRRSTQAASIGVWYRAGPPLEAAPLFWASRLCARFDSRVNCTRLHLRHAKSENLNGILCLAIASEPGSHRKAAKRQRLQDECSLRHALSLRIASKATDWGEQKDWCSPTGPRPEGMLARIMP